MKDIQVLLQDLKSYGECIFKCLKSGEESRCAEVGGRQASPPPPAPEPAPAPESAPEPAPAPAGAEPAAQQPSTGQGLDEFAVFQGLLELSTVKLETRFPDMIASKMGEAEQLVEKVREIVGERGHGDYFNASTKRYVQYFAAALGVPLGKEILDIGNAPGHAAIGLDLLGHRVTGVNRDPAWRAVYPSPEWLAKFNVIECDVETEQLPFESGSFDGVFFTEVLEHIAIANPVKVCRELHRVLKPGGVMVFSTPNVCNISNLYALTRGINVFWAPDIFYGSLDRHNREYTPDEVETVLRETGFARIEMYGFNCDSNWRSGAAEFAYRFAAAHGDEHALLRNTTMALCWK